MSTQKPALYKYNLTNIHQYHNINNMAIYMCTKGEINTKKTDIYRTEYWNHVANTLNMSVILSVILSVSLLVCG
jgi:hypothetical protein